MTNTLKIPEKNLEYYKLENYVLGILAVLGGTLIGYVYAILDIMTNMYRAYPDMPEAMSDTILGIDRSSRFGIFLVVIVAGAVLFVGLWLYLRHEANKGLTKGVADLEIAWHERIIDELRQKNLKARGEYIEKAKKVDEIEALMTGREGHQ